MLWNVDSMLAKLALMVPVGRRLWPTSAPQVHTFSWPRLHRLNRIGRPVAAGASRIAVERVRADTPVLLRSSYFG
ncbi:hypothetical protein GCM10010246_58970 [Streptomyces cuspidosporus]|uniref:Transposase n=1 Tax=Streptomyces cuspidosporus TaxID=66882 RepID=A0ABN3GTF9_9ACTN